jgi:hypothetical protein
MTPHCCASRLILVSSPMGRAGLPLDCAPLVLPTLRRPENKIMAESWLKSGEAWEKTGSDFHAERI